MNVSGSLFSPFRELRAALQFNPIIVEKNLTRLVERLHSADEPRPLVTRWSLESVLGTGLGCSIRSLGTAAIVDDYVSFLVRKDFDPALVRRLD